MSPGPLGVLCHQTRGVVPWSTAVTHQQVSYQRDHVYLFDATGATRSSSAVSDPALSSYFIPALPPPPPPLSATTPRPPVRPATQRRASTATGGDGGRQGGGRFSGGAARAGHGEEPDAAGVTAGRVLEAHRALAAWDARGGIAVQYRLHVFSVFLSTFVWMRCSFRCSCQGRFVVLGGCVCFCGAFAARRPCFEHLLAAMIIPLRCSARRGGERETRRLTIRRRQACVPQVIHLSTTFSLVATPVFQRCHSYNGGFDCPCYNFFSLSSISYAR